jgi:DNA adenine methylase
MAHKHIQQSVCADQVNRKGDFNVPFGDYKNPTICDADNLLTVSRVLKQA